MIASTLIAQNLFGESQGVGLLRRLYDRYFAFRPESELAKALQVQIADEVRHVRLFSALHSHYKEESIGKRPQVAPAWERIFDFLRADGSLPSNIVGVYGLIEPFNLIATRDLILPLLGSEDRALVAEALKDEEAHVAMMPHFIELIRQEGLLFDRRQISRLIQLFLSSQREGIILPDGRIIRLDEPAQKEFLSQIRQLLKCLGRVNAI